jgi:hypothetical protein
LKIIVTNCHLSEKPMHISKSYLFNKSRRIQAAPKISLRKIPVTPSSGLTTSGNLRIAEHEI